MSKPSVTQSISMKQADWEIVESYMERHGITNFSGFVRSLIAKLPPSTEEQIETRLQEVRLQMDALTKEAMELEHARQGLIQMTLTRTSATSTYLDGQWACYEKYLTSTGSINSYSRARDWAILRLRTDMARQELGLTAEEVIKYVVDKAASLGYKSQGVVTLVSP